MSVQVRCEGMTTSSAAALRLGIVLVCIATAALGLCACNGGGGPSPAGSSSANAAQEHSYPEQGFSLRYGPRWRQEIQPASQGWKWTLTISDMSGASAGGIGGRGRIAVTAEPNRGQANPTQYRKGARALLDRILDRKMGIAGDAVDDGSGSIIHHLFRPLTVNGTPALMAAVRQGDARNGTETEWYVIGTRRHIYAIIASGPAATWDDEAPTLRSVVETFTVLEE